jgi:DNA-3-methyladenine glycosylase II
MTTTTTMLSLRPRGPFSLAASAWFLEGFTPAAHDASPPGHFHLAFPGEASGEGTGVCCTQPTGPDGPVEVEVVHGDDSDADGRQVARILALDQDGTGFSAVLEREPVIRRPAERYAGLRPVAFFSPYEAGAWALISARISIRQAARLKARMAEALGTRLEIHGETMHAFPAPTVLAGLESFPGLFGRKPEWLRALARAAFDGRLDAEWLRSMPEADAIAELEELPGIGPFSAGLILIRGANTPDALPAAEPRLRRAVALAYGLVEEPSFEKVTEIAEAWRPYRTWVTLLLRRALEDATGEITGRRVTEGVEGSVSGA